MYGPLHGGANEAVLRMLERIGSVDRIDSFLEGVKAKKEKMFGFGHRCSSLLTAVPFKHVKMCSAHRMTLMNEARQPAPCCYPFMSSSVVKHFLLSSSFEMMAAAQVHRL